MTKDELKQLLKEVKVLLREYRTHVETGDVVRYTDKGREEKLKQIDDVIGKDKG